MLLFVQILGGLGACVAFAVGMISLSDRLQERKIKRKIIKQVREERALEAAKNAPIFEALEEPELIDLGEPKNDRTQAL